MRKIVLTLLLVGLSLFLYSCKEERVEYYECYGHTFEYVITEDTHQKHYTCLCEDEEVEAHFDNDSDGLCDVCAFEMPQEEVIELQKTYYLPYKNVSYPIAITFDDKIGLCSYTFNKENESSKMQIYEVIDNYVYIYNSSSQNYYVFEITKYGIVYDEEKSTTSFWNVYQKSIIYYTQQQIDEKLMISAAYQSIYNLPTLPDVTIYDSYEVNGDTAYAVYVEIPTAGSKWSQKIYGTKYTFTYNDDREVLIFYTGGFYDLLTALGRKYIVEEDLEVFYINHHNCDIEHSYDDGVIMENEEVVPGGQYYILYTCYECGHRQTYGVPQAFNFSISFGFDGYYDSKTGHLRNGYNCELDIECETTLILDELELLNVYRIFTNGNIDKYKGKINASEDMFEPSYNIIISYEINGEQYKITIYGASHIRYYEWEEGMELGYAYHKILRDYIYSSDEYKSLPPNTNIYD